MKKLIVNDEVNNIRIDKYLIEELEYSRSKIQKLITSDKILVNGQKIKSSYIVKVDDEINITGEIDNDIHIKAENITLDIYYEDDDLLVVNKPSGMVVHPSLGHRCSTLVNALLYHCNKLSDINGDIRPGIVHRIDKDTSGLLVVAKNNEAHVELAKQLKEKKMTRKYIALVHGIIPHNNGTIDAPIGRDLIDRKKMAITESNAKEAITHFTVINRLKETTLIECQLETGRTHQIRLHLKYIGFPIVNDPVYGIKKTINDYGQMLHAKTLGFYHPTTNKYLEFSASTPDEFDKIVDNF